MKYMHAGKRLQLDSASLSVNSGRNINEEERMFKKLITVVLVAVLLLAAASCVKQPSTKIVIATDATFPPMEMLDQNKAIVGFDIDLMNAAAKAGGFEVEFRNTAWDGIFPGLDGNKYDAIMSSVTITDERKAQFDFSTPYVNAGQILTVRTETTGVATLADLAGKTVGAQIGTTGAMAINDVKEVKMKVYDEIGLAFADLANGRIDGVVVDNPVAANYALQSADYKGKLKIVGQPFTTEFYGVVVKKGNTKVLDLINKGLKAVADSGEAKKIEEKWLR
jgi:polar amino acid transport system substrate-binding protein